MGVQGIVEGGLAFNPEGERSAYDTDAANEPVVAVILARSAERACSPSLRRLPSGFKKRVIRTFVAGQ